MHSIENLARFGIKTPKSPMIFLHFIQIQRSTKKTSKKFDRCVLGIKSFALFYLEKNI